MIAVRLDIPEAWVGRARYAFGALALRWGIPIRFTADAGAADITYSGDPAARAWEGCALTFDPRLYEPGTMCRALHEPSGRWIWRRADLPAGDAPDLVGGAFRLLTYLDESQVAEERRDRRGVFVTEALPPERRRMADRPLVEHHAAAVLDAVLRRRPRLEQAREQRWPDGRRIALVPTHDVDAVDLGAPLELVANLAKSVLRRSGDHVKLLTHGLSTLGSRSPGPYFAFPRWREWERERRLRSAFFVFVLPTGVRRDLNDCKSSLDGRRVDWEALRRMAADGWEFGLHAAINTRDTPAGFEDSKSWLEAKLGSAVHGLRHHYWAIDWRDPTVTHRQHQRAGFRYDSSIAWRDRAGFRAGTALPYQPFDPIAQAALDLVELPCTLMDGHVLDASIRGAPADPESGLRAGGEIVERVWEAGGMLVTNWHQEAASDRVHFKGYVETLDRLLAPLYGSSEVWVATPDEVSAHWQRRASSLLGAAGDGRR